MLGTNDTRTMNWDKNNEDQVEKFFKDWAEIANSLKNLPSKPEFYVMIPPPIYLKPYVKLMEEYGEVPDFNETSEEYLNGKFKTLIP